MKDEQFKLLMDAMLRIIELLEKLDKPKMNSVVNQRGLPGDMYLYQGTDLPPFTPITQAIGKELPPDPKQDPSK